MKKIKVKKGFTLPEILVAASIMISLFALISATLWDYSKISVKAQIELRIQEKLRNAMKKLDKEILWSRAVLPYYKIGTNSTTGTGESIPGLSKCFLESAPNLIRNSLTPGSQDCTDGKIIRTSAKDGILILSIPVFDPTSNPLDRGNLRERNNRFDPRSNTVIVLYKTKRYGREQLRMARYPAIREGTSKQIVGGLEIIQPGLTNKITYYQKPDETGWREKPRVVSDIVFDYLSPRKPKVDSSGKPNLRVKKPVGDPNKDGEPYDLFTIFRDPLTTDILDPPFIQDERKGTIEYSLGNPYAPNYQNKYRYLKFTTLGVPGISDLYLDPSFEGFPNTYTQAGAVVGFKIELWGAEDYGDGYVARSRDNYVRLDFTGENGGG